MNHTIFALCVLLLSLLNLSQTAVDQIRSRAIVLFSTAMPASLRATSESRELKNLQLENQQLRNQLDLIYEWLSSEKRLKEELAQFQTIYKDTQISKKILDRRSEEIKTLLQKQAIAAFGRIIYRDPSSWSSSCWIDVGEENNIALGKTIIAKNSPIVSGSCLVGVVEYVGKRQSRIRLITDASLKTAVRAIRGSIVDREIASLVHALLERLQKHPAGQAGPLAGQLAQFEKTFPIHWEDNYFAKGEIFGGSAPYFRSFKSGLKGIGFNCDFPDIEGPSRDLRAEILREGDLLVTSGLDGVFPAGLKVGIVTKIKSLEAGAFAYELDAAPAAGDLFDLTSICVLPPMGIDE